MTTDFTDTDGKHRSGLVHGDITNAIISAAYRVHSRLGPGLLERVYKVCLSHELKRLGILHVVEKLLPVEYDGLTLELGYRIDLLVADAVIVEVKAVDAISPTHDAQLLAYLRLSRKRVGLLINLNVADRRNGIRRKISGY